MKARALLVPTCLVLAAGCFRESPVRVEDGNLGIIAVFPGQPRMHKYVEDTPFGQMEWFSTTYETPGRMDRSFYVDVGNLPPGDQGGKTESEVLATYRAWLTRRLGRPELADLPPDRGPGFRYKATLANGSYVEGIAIVKRGRLHHAEAGVAKADDPALRTFLDGFQVMP